MASARVFNRLCFRFFLILTLLLVLFNESLVYYLSHSKWQQIACKSENCTRILFIADPQLIGERYEHSIFSPLARADSDRYLRKTFLHALEFTKPHIICFLGDLLDEGSIANEAEYARYVQRFRRIYRTKLSAGRIHVPGDNDIGGEDGEYISNLNLRRFSGEFMNEDLFDFDNRLRFFKINRMLLDFTNPDKAHNAVRLRIGISHAPIIIGGGPLLRSVITELDPHVIFTGHWHESRIFIYPKTKAVNFYEHSIRHFDLKALKEQQAKQFVEIMVPTASYRMGKVLIGLGYGVFENYDLRYTVLWLPNRFICLFVYLFWMLLMLCAAVLHKMMTSCPFRKRQTPYNRMLVNVA